MRDERLVGLERTEALAGGSILSYALIMESQYYLAIGVAFFGFLGLAFLLLFPVYRFLDREDKVAEQWTEEALAKRQKRDAPSDDGASDEAKPPAEAP